MREAIAGRVNGAVGDTGALRAAFAAVFDHVMVLHGGLLDDECWGEPIGDGDWCVVPWLRDDALVPHEGGVGRVIKRVPLGLNADADKCNATQVEDQISTRPAYMDQTSERGTARA